MTETMNATANATAMLTMLRCVSCETVQLATEFPRDARKTTGRSSYCRECYRWYNAEGHARRTGRPVSDAHVPGSEMPIRPDHRVRYHNTEKAYPKRKQKVCAFPACGTVLRYTRPKRHNWQALYCSLHETPLQRIEAAERLAERHAGSRGGA